MSRSSTSGEFNEAVLVDQTVNWSASVRMRLPVLRREREERFPLTGWSRLAIQTTVADWRCCWVNQMAKQ